VDGVIDENEEYKPRREIMREVETLRQENITMREELHRKDILLKRYEAELKRYRAAPWLEDAPGIVQLSEDLISILKGRGSVEDGRLLEELGIDRRERDLAKAIHKQLESLQAFGAVKHDGDSWVWLW
jgi:dsDNA-specific endonuclease/ATPase MutS2